MPRRTKIVCTIGPASAGREALRALIEAGMDVARLNFSHGDHDDHRRVLETVREEAHRAGRVVPVLQDLQGPKIRVGTVEDGCVLIHKGQRLTITTEPIKKGSAEKIYVSYPTLTDDVEPGRRILLDDGLLELEIKEVHDHEIVTEVVVGGPLRSRKGVNLPDIRTSTPSMTDKDLSDLEFGLSVGVDAVALSFVRTQSDVAELTRRVRESGENVSVIAKIEKPEAVRRIDNILLEADGIMVARGDLGIEMPMAKVPGTQKMIIRKCLAAAKPVITATQMLESMIDNPRPTRAEASDVANAVLDGSDAVMLSGETAVGKHPARVVQVMAEIIAEAEEHYNSPFDPQPDTFAHDGEVDVTESVSYTTVQLAEQVGAAAIACMTNSGTTAKTIARHRPTMPIYAFTNQERVVGQLALVWGTKAFEIPFQRDTDRGVALVHQILSERGCTQPGDLVVLTAGMPLPAKGRTNMIHVSQA